MNSKEALDNLRFDVLMLHNIDYIRSNNECDIIEKDLDRLEKLEKTFEILKKSLLLSVVEIRGYYYVCAHDNNYFMKKEEADLIKEVLEND